MSHVKNYMILLFSSLKAAEPPTPPRMYSIKRQRVVLCMYRSIDNRNVYCINAVITGQWAWAYGDLTRSMHISIGPLGPWSPRRHSHPQTVDNGRILGMEIVRILRSFDICSKVRLNNTLSEIRIKKT